MPTYHQLSEDELALVKAWRDREQGGVLEWLGKRNPPPTWTEQPIKELCGDELEVDTYPMASEADDGYWVSVWAWVADTTVVDNEDEQP